jgi:DNA polymerase-3 subunit delta'
MELLIHPRTQHQIEALIASPGGSVMLHGPQNVGKQTLAYEVARQINCLGCDDASCHSCRMVRSHNHPDIIGITPDEKGKIGIEAVHQLQHDLQFRQYESGAHRVVIVADAHTMTIPAQNALLKTLEEPPVGTTMLITVTSPVAVLETIASRCRPLYVAPTTMNATESYLRSRPNLDRATLSEAARLSGGRIGRALNLATDPERLEQQRLIGERVMRLTAAPSLFERLIVAGEMTQKGEDVRHYLEALTDWGRQAARERAELAAHNLSAIERLRSRIGANVGPKVALEAFAAEVVC